MMSVEKLLKLLKPIIPHLPKSVPKIYAGGISIFAISVRDCSPVIQASWKNKRDF